MGRKDKPTAAEQEQAFSLGAQLRRERQAQIISLTDMARRVGYTKSYLSGVENGSIRASQKLVEQYERELQLPSGKLTAGLQIPSENQRSFEERPWSIPYQQNPFFTGRDEMLNRMHKQLTRMRRSPYAIAITGLAGIGKTQLAIEYAYQYRSYYQAVFWLRGDSSEVLLAEFANIAASPVLPIQNMSSQSVIIDSVKRWLRQNAPCLLIIDSLDTIQELVTLDKLLSQLGETRIILTTRLQAVGGIAQALELEKMESDAAALFLLQRVHALSSENSLDDVAGPERVDALEIAYVMDGLPLALDQAGSYIEETGCTLSHYLTLFAMQRAQLLRQRGFALDHPESVTTTWSLAFQAIQEANRSAADLLYLCAFLHPDAIYRDIVVEGASVLGSSLRPIAADPIALDQTIGELRKYSLVHSNPKTGVLTIHRLVQAVIKDLLDQGTQRSWAERVVRAMCEVFPLIEGVEVTEWKERRAKCRLYFAHAQVSSELIRQWRMVFVEAARLLSKLGKYLEDISAFADAERVFIEALEIDKQLEGTDIDQLILDYNDLAIVCEKQKNYKQAEIHYKEIFKMQQSAREQMQVSAAMIKVLRNYAAFLEAINRKEEALKIRESTAGQSQREVKHVTINDSDKAIMYQGTWESLDSEEESGDYGGNKHYTEDEKASFQYTFTGIGVAVIADTTSELSLGIVDIYIDDIYAQRKDLSKESEHLPQTVIFHTSRLEYGVHTIRGDLVKGAFALDALVIFTYEEPAVEAS
jgi:transcriptional regulator with XRE-family HTH domain